MSMVFLSYRRQDSEDVSGRIYDHLIARYGEGSTFKDVDSILGGMDFRSSIAEAMAQCEIFLAVIGQHWLTVTDEQGGRRLDNPGDYVRREVEGALERSIPVIPVLIRGAAMPNEQELPGSIQDLHYRQAIEVRSDPYFRSDMGRLFDHMDRIIASRRAAAEAEARRQAEAQALTEARRQAEAAAEEQRRREALAAEAAERKRAARDAEQRRQQASDAPATGQLTAPVSNIPAQKPAAPVAGADTGYVAIGIVFKAVPFLAAAILFVVYLIEVYSRNSFTEAFHDAAKLTGLKMLLGMVGGILVIVVAIVCSVLVAFILLGIAGHSYHAATLTSWTWLGMVVGAVGGALIGSRTSPGLESILVGSSLGLLVLAGATGVFLPGFGYKSKN